MRKEKIRCSPQKGKLPNQRKQKELGKKEKHALQMLHHVSTAWLERFGWWWANRHQTVFGETFTTDHKYFYKNWQRVLEMQYQKN